MAFVSRGPSENELQIGNENVNRKMKKEAIATKNPQAGNTKRTALGNITNQLRVQPARAAKPKDEKKTQDTKQPFKIFVDDNSENVEPKKTKDKSKAESDIKLDTAIAAVIRRPLSTTSTTNEHEVLEISDASLSSVDSPMDTSLNVSRCEAEKKPMDREAIILSAPEYADDIYTYLKEAETRSRPKVGYIKKQPDLTVSMRSILVDWLVEVAEEYKLNRETLFLAVNYIDRFLSQMSVLRGKLQLVGAASVFLAGKYEEIYPPDVGEFVYITDDTYTKKQVLRMEHLILKVLNFDVAVPTTNWFCDSMLNILDADQQTRDLAMYLCELTLVDSEIFLKYLPSTVAASAICLANCTLGQEAWPSLMVEKTKFEESDLKECLNDLLDTFTNAADHPQQAVREKYRSSKFNQVSALTPPAELDLKG